MITRDDLLGMNAAVWRGRIVAAAATTGLFDALTTRPRPADAVAADAGTDARATELTLNALTALKLVRRTTRGYTATAASRRFLRTDAPETVVSALRHHDGLASTWARLADVIRTGKPVPRAPAERRRRMPTFIGAMHDLALDRAPLVAKHFAKQRMERMLDVGGGSGIYSVHFCRLHRRLQSTLFDRRETLNVARRILSRYPERKRIRFWPGDLDTHSVPKGFDLILLSHVMHSSGEDAIRTWFDKLLGSLRPGGQLVIQDFLTNPARTAPVRAAVFAINMLVATPDGRTYSKREVSAWLREAGFKGVREIRALADDAASVLVARVPS